MATKTDRDFDLQQQNLDLKQEKLQMVDEMNKYKQQALMQQMELNKAKTSALLGDQGTWHEGGPMQFAQAGSDITGLAYSAPYREGGNYIELNKPFQAANPYQTPEAFNYTPRELTPPEEIEVSAQDQAELDSVASRFYDVQKQLSSIKYSGNPKEKELRNEAAQLEYLYKQLSYKARDNYKIAKEGLGKGYLSSFDVNSGDRRYYADYDPAMVLKQYSDAIIQLNQSLNRAVVGSADYNRIIRDRERMRNDLIRRRDTAPTKELAFSYQAEIDKLGRPTRDLAAEAEIEDKKRAWGKDDQEVRGSAVLLDRVLRGEPTAIAAINARNKDVRFVREGDFIVVQQAMETVKTGEHTSDDGSMSRGDVTTKKWGPKSKFRVGDAGAFTDMAAMLYRDEKLSNRISSMYTKGEFDKDISSMNQRNVVHVNPDLQQHIRKNPKNFAKGLESESLRNMFTIDGKKIVSVTSNASNNSPAKFTLSDGSIVEMGKKDDIESADRFGISDDALNVLYDEDKSSISVPSMLITRANGKREKISIYKKDRFSGSRGRENTVNNTRLD